MCLQRSSCPGVTRAFIEGLRDLGYVEGRNFVFEPRYAGGKLERLPDQAAELVRLRADVIVAGTNPAVAAVKRATATIPIVMASVVDPSAPGSSRIWHGPAETSPG